MSFQVMAPKFSQWGQILETALFTIAFLKENCYGIAFSRVMRNTLTGKN